MKGLELPAAECEGCHVEYLASNLAPHSAILANDQDETFEAVILQLCLRCWIHGAGG